MLDLQAKYVSQSAANLTHSVFEKYIVILYSNYEKIEFYR